MTYRTENTITTLYSWLLQDKHKRKMRELKQEAERAFTEHPEQTGETYWQHLLFTVKMATRFGYVSMVIMIHGLFPFLFVTTASRQIELIYRIMKSRIPKQRREMIDAMEGYKGDNI